MKVVLGIIEGITKLEAALLGVRSCLLAENIAGARRGLQVIKMLADDTDLYFQTLENWREQEQGRGAAASGCDAAKS